MPASFVKISNQLGLNRMQEVICVPKSYSESSADRSSANQDMLNTKHGPRGLLFKPLLGGSCGCPAGRRTVSSGACFGRVPWEQEELLC